MNQYPKISIVTPCFNQKEYIGECIESILSQQYPNLEYIIIDGGSTDGTVDIIRQYADKLHFWMSASDSGLYDALNKGFSYATGEIMGWLNSDDILHRKSLFTIGQIFSDLPQVQWLQGYPCVIDSNGRVVYHRPQRSTKYSFYLKEYHDGIFIQQESTYWRRDLWVKSGSCISTEYKYAGDFELWIRFFNFAKLYNSQALLGAFRVRKGQLSEINLKEYLMECDVVIDRYAKLLTAKELAEIASMKRLQNRRRVSSILRRFGVISTTAYEKPVSVNFDFKTSGFVEVQ